MRTSAKMRQGQSEQNLKITKASIPAHSSIFASSVKKSTCSANILGLGSTHNLPRSSSEDESCQRSEATHA
eukprot:1500142-Amphidinium_carterae.3